MIFSNHYHYHDKPMRFSHHYHSNFNQQQYHHHLLNSHGQHRLPYNFMHCTFCVLYFNGYITLQEYAKQQEIKHRRKIILPCVIPWEYGSNKYASQKGTGGFGAIRNASKLHFDFISSENKLRKKFFQFINNLPLNITYLSIKFFFRTKEFFEI